MHEVLVNRLGGLSLPRKSVVRLTDHPDMTLDVYRGRKTTMQQQLISQQKHVVTSHLNCLEERILMMCLKICFNGKIWIIIPKLSLLPLLIWNTDVMTIAD